MKKLVCKASGFLALIVIASSCAPDDAQVSRDIEINNDAAALSTRMMEKNEAITIVSSNAGKKAKDIELTLKAELEPPAVNGDLLQATSISRDGNNLVVSYNFAGDTYYGGIDLIDSKVQLKSEIQFNDADVNDITILGDEVYFAGGTSSLESPAFVEKVSIKKGVFTLDGNTRINIGSYTANSITNSESEIYVTSGNDDTTGGGVYQLSRDLTQQNYQSIKDARWVVEKDGVVFCLSGNPSNVNFFNEGLSTKGNFTHNAFSNAESKMTMDVDDNLIFIAGGAEGLLVYDLDGNLVLQHTFDDNSITNAVTADDGNIFISNGEGGVHVASYDDGEVDIIGKLQLDSKESVNHILLKGNKLYVASGLGGVKMIEVK
ncbi:MAG: hypothetical protein ABJP45_14475 [Cyclobacteriaceae bacterium]